VHSTGPEIAVKNVMGWALILEIRLVAGGLEEGRELVAGNQHFPQHLAAGQFAPGQEPPDGLGAHIEDLGGLVNVIQQGFNGGGFAGSVGRRFNVRGHFFVFGLRSFIASRAPVFAKLGEKICPAKLRNLRGKIAGKIAEPIKC
jgi:hypothetical protein